MEIHIRQGESGRFAATSPQISDLLVCADTAQEVLAVVAEVVWSMRARDGGNTRVAYRIHDTPARDESASAGGPSQPC